MPWQEKPWVALYLTLSTVKKGERSGDVAQLECLPNMLGSISELHNSTCL